MAAIFRIGILVLRISIAELCAKKLRNTVSPSQALFKQKIRNARLNSALGNETLVTAISNSNIIPILRMNKCLFSARAYSMLLDSKRFKPAGDILSLGKKEFSNKMSGSTAKPAWLIPLLGKAMRSVGRLTADVWVSSGDVLFY